MSEQQKNDVEMPAAPNDGKPTRKTDGGKRAPTASPEETEHEVSDVNARVGKAMRELRSQRGQSLREIADATGFSVSFLSLVERGRSSLSLTSLQKVAAALDTTVPKLFPPEFASEHGQPLPHVERADDRATLTILNSDTTIRLLSGRAPDRVLEPMLGVLNPLCSTQSPYGHEGEEFLYVLEGEITFVVDGVEYDLGPGDSIHYPSTLGHDLENRSPETPARYLAVVTPRFF